MLRPFGDQIFGNRYIYFDNLKPNSFYRAVGVFSDLNNPLNLTRVYVDFETSNHTIFNVTSKNIRPQKMRTLCYPQFALDTCPMRTFACGNLETYFLNYPRFSAAVQDETDLRITEYIRSCCLCVPKDSKTTPIVHNSSLGSSNLTIISINPQEFVPLMKEARNGTLNVDQKRRLEVFHRYFATLDEKYVSIRYLMSKDEVSHFSELQDRVARLYNKYTHGGQISFRSPNLVDVFEDQLKKTPFWRKTCPYPYPTWIRLYFWKLAIANFILKNMSI